MHIAISSDPLESGHLNRGVGQYTKLLIDALQKYQSQHSYLFFTRGQKVPENIDLVHYPYFDPFFLTLPIYKSKPTVVTVHDLIPIAFSDHFPRGLRGELKWQIQKLSLRGASRVITDSEASKRDIHRLVSYPKERIDVVYLAPSPIFRPIKDTSVLEKIRKKYNLPPQFILYVGDVNWNKNIVGMLEAFQKLKAQSSKLKIIKLVVVGKAFLQKSVEMDNINNLLAKAKLNDSVLRLGFVPEEDLVAMYNLASVYVQPSFAEGFGLPVLEAMACGMPVVAAKGSSLDEIAGPATRVDPYDASDIAKGLQKMFSLSNHKQEALKKSGLDWVKRFRWECVAEETVATYEKVLERI